MTPNPQDELLDRARKTIRELRDKLAAAETRGQREPIAVIGMAFRFPGAGTDAGRLWQMIAEGRDAVRPVPADRWDREAFFSPENPAPGKINTRQAAFLDDVRRFDAGFFDITPREAVQMDPQQRIFLETAWHALEDAGMPRERIAGTESGVFAGVHNHSADYQAMQFRSPETLDAWSATGTAHDVIAGRLAYWLDLRGPAMAVNTACSSSLAAVHLACRSLRTNECTVALAGGINLLLGPGSTVAAAQLELLSPDGRCRTFDARAAGMGRGEGCGVAVLKKLSAALSDGDRVLAVIRGSSMNQDGRTNGLTAPSGLAQQRLLRLALEDAGVNAGEIDYIETHGTGTALGDPIEVEALAEVIGSARRPNACVLGAVKANLGHLEGAAGIAGLIKAVMVLRRRWIPPVANLEKLNPHFALEGAGIEIPRTGRAWSVDHPRLAGVSSFGFSGTNVHVVLEEAPAERALSTGNGPYPVLVSARSPQALRVLATAYADRLETAGTDELAAIAYTSTLRRTHHAHRIAVFGANAAQMAGDLRRRTEESAHRNATGAVRIDEKLAQWEAGSKVDFQEFFPKGGCVVDLPLYPFEGREYWLDETAGGGMAWRTPTGAKFESAIKAERQPDRWFYAVNWVRKDLEVLNTVETASPATWLVVGAESELSRRLANSIRARGDTAVAFEPQVFHGGSNVAMNMDRYARCLVEVSKEGAPLRYVVYTSGEQDAADATAEALAVTQAILKSELSLGLWFLTKGAGSVGEIASAAHTALQGFCRVAGLEHSEVMGSAIEADLESAQAVCDEIMCSGAEDRVAFRAGMRWVARLRRESGARPAPMMLKAERSYLVTGAFGNIGMEVAAGLIAAGARHIVLVGRRDPAQMGKPEILERIEAWRAEGVNVRARACDVADEAEVRGMLSAMDAAGAPLSGVIHAAASMRFCSLEQASPEDVTNAFLAKVDGARILDRCTRDRNLDFFVLFSSGAATIGLRNGAVYAAANAALEAVATDRLTLGLPTLCVEWGLWGSSGRSARQEMMEQLGFASMRPDLAMAALGASIAERRKHCIIADIDWGILGPVLEMRGRRPLIEDLIAEAELRPLVEDSGAKTAWLRGLGKLSPKERRNRMLDFVAAETRQVFGLAPDEAQDESRGLFAMGMNSLMSVQLKRRLEAGTGLRLPGTLTLTYPSIAALAGYLESAIFGKGGDMTAQGAAPPTADVELHSLEKMNDAETSAALAAELAAVRQKLGAVEV
jgi:acyl transferase domain-containing protein